MRVVKIVAESRTNAKAMHKNVDGNYKMIGCAQGTSKCQLFRSVVRTSDLIAAYPTSNPRRRKWKARANRDVLARCVMIT